MLGLYIHVPFCAAKCPYCDFYSTPCFDDDLLDRYTSALCERLDRAAEALNQQADTLYFGGGTPSLLGGRRLATLIDRAAAGFGLSDAEITLEANPADDLADTLATFAAAGGNRLSLGMQAANDRELAALGRRHRIGDMHRTVEDAHRAGVDNLSLDVMLATPGQTEESVWQAAETCRALGAKHVSAYLLKIEEGTPFAGRREELTLPEETAAERYLLACRIFEEAGFAQYEISNFSRPGYESRHNLKYWNSEPYLGLGPAAHSFLSGKRWEYPRDLTAFLAGASPVAEDEEATVTDASPVEYAMLRLRLVKGLTEEDFQTAFGTPIPARWKKAAAALPRRLVQCDERGICLTREGFLLENPITAKILD